MKCVTLKPDVVKKFYPGIPLDVYVRCGTAPVQFCSVLHYPANPTGYVLSAVQHSTAGLLELQDRGNPTIITESHVTAVIHIFHKHNNKNCSQLKDETKCLEQYFFLCWSQHGTFYYDNGPDVMFQLNCCPVLRVLVEI